MMYLFIFLLIVILLFSILGSGKQQKKTGTISGDFTSCGQLNTKTEQKFKLALSERLPAHLELHCKVRLADLCKPKDPRNFTSLNKVTSKHVDVVIVAAKTSEIVCAIELDDASHRTKRAKLQDSEKNYALDAAGIPLYRIKPRANYDNVIHDMLSKHP